jgi:hypothetical protein
MKTFTLNYVYMGFEISQSVHLADMVEQMTPPLKIETIIDFISLINLDDKLELWQKIYLREKLKQVKNLIKC